MASPVDTTVKLFRDDMVGISGVAALAGVSGRTIAILDLCLVTGTATRNVTSLVVSGGIATITTPTDANNVNMVGSVQLIANVTGGMTGATDLNGEQRIISATATTMTFATAVVNGTATTGSTITTKLAPAGWAKTYTGTNLAEFHIIDVAGSGFYIRVDDTATTTCQVREHWHRGIPDSGRIRKCLLLEEEQHRKFDGKQMGLVRGFTVFCVLTAGQQRQRTDKHRPSTLRIWRPGCPQEYGQFCDHLCGGYVRPHRRIKKRQHRFLRPSQHHGAVRQKFDRPRRVFGFLHDTRVRDGWVHCIR